MLQIVKMQKMVLLKINQTSNGKDKEILKAVRNFARYKFTSEDDVEDAFLIEMSF